MALNGALNLLNARKQNMSKIDFYHVNYENLAINSEPAALQNHLFQHGIYLDRTVDVLALGKTAAFIGREAPCRLAARRTLP